MCLWIASNTRSNAVFAVSNKKKDRFDLGSVAEERHQSQAQAIKGSWLETSNANYDYIPLLCKFPFTVNDVFILEAFRKKKTKITWQINIVLTSKTTNSIWLESSNTLPLWVTLPPRLSIHCLFFSLGGVFRLISAPYFITFMSSTRGDKQRSQVWSIIIINFVYRSVNVFFLEGEKWNGPNGSPLI